MTFAYHSMTRNFIVCCIYFSALFAPKLCEASFKIELGNLKVTNPEQIQGHYDISLANFGTPLYGASLRGIIQYAGAGVLGCATDFEPEGFPEGFEVKHTPGYAPIVIITRGECKFTEKAWNAQKLGAAAVLIADNVEEHLLTMDQDKSSPYLGNISIPVAMMTKSDATKLIDASEEQSVVVTIDWSDVLPNPDERVEWEIWTNSNNGCGRFCKSTNTFVERFAPYAKQLEANGQLLFTPHYVTWMCLDEYKETKECLAQCISGGKYCAPDPEDKFDEGYDGKDVVRENLRALCVYDQANKTGNPTLWWDYVIAFHRNCKMDEEKFNVECSEEVQQSIGADVELIRLCAAGDSNEQHPLLQAQIDAQIGSDGRSDVELLPSIIINNAQYRGKLDVKSVLKALCAGFKTDTEPEVCLSDDVSDNECLEGGIGFNECKANQLGNTKCMDTFRGWECVCPEGTFSYVNSEGETACADVNECKGQAMELPECNCDRCVCTNTQPGFHCAAAPEQCTATDHQTCWHEELNVSYERKKTVMAPFTACVDNLAALQRDGLIGGGNSSAYYCQCPPGFEGDGFKVGSGCTNINECETQCMGDHMHCVDIPGSFQCTCSHNGILSDDKSVCIYPNGYPKVSSGLGGGIIAGVVIGVLAVVALAGYGLYRYRLRSYMDSEIRAIMAQYMPLDKENENEAPEPANNL